MARARLNRRNTHVITVTPKDEFRYGYRLWIDDSTAMPLKTQLCDAHGQVIEQIVFANLTLPSHIPDAAFRPEFSTEGFHWVRDMRPPLMAPAPDSSAWKALRLPPGFHMTLRSAQTLPGSTQVVDHIVFTDGVASVSVFVEHRETTIQAGRRRPRAGFCARGHQRRGQFRLLDRRRRAQDHRRGRGAPGDRAVHRHPGEGGGERRRRHTALMVRLTVVQRHDCELCEEMLAALERLGRERALPPIEIIDVDTDPQLARRHGLHVPVLLLAGTVVCRHRLDRAGARAAAARAAHALKADGPRHARHSPSVCVFPYNRRPPLDPLRGITRSGALLRFHAAYS